MKYQVSYAGFQGSQGLSVLFVYFDRILFNFCRVRQSHFGLLQCCQIAVVLIRYKHCTENPDAFLYQS